ncbi:MAG: hypothetical protein GXP16_15155 [Gammaproteobacteria bacterium]|nr:hypothetical protein [Gammaproteobacteria bacterium]
MHQAFVEIPPNLAHHLAHHVLLTPNERLAKEFLRGYENAQLEQGQRAWRTPRIFTLKRYLLEEFRHHSSAPTKLLSEAELLQVAHATQPFKSRTTTSQFMQAWSLVYSYGIQLDDNEFSATRAQLFKQWFEAVHTQLGLDQQANALITEQIPDWLINNNAVPNQPLMLAFFDQLTPAEQRYLEWASQHVQVEYHQLHTSRQVPQNLDVSITSCLNLQEELAAACQWALATKIDSPQARIGIVVPSLAQNYHKVIRQCGVILDPTHGSLSGQFDISGGRALNQQRVWLDALLLLDGLTHGYDQQQLSYLAQSHFFDLDELDTLSKSWPSGWSKKADIQNIAEQCSSNSAKNIAQQYASLADQRDQRTFAGWIEWVLQVLLSAGWPHTSELHSSQYQAHQAIVQLLTNQPDYLQENLDLPTALEVIDLVLSRQMFAPKRPAADIMVLGVLETTGLVFTHLWVCELDEENFPSQNTAHPFIPRRVAQRYAIPRSSQPQELVFAEQMLQSWQRSTQNLQLSFSRTSSGSDRLASPLVADWPLHEFTGKSCHPYHQPSTVALEYFIDDHGLAVDEGFHRGGAGLIQDQTECAFRAYAQHRLKLKRLEAPGSLPDSLTRGSVLHDCLHRILQTNPSHQDLLNISDANVVRVCQQALDTLPQSLPATFVAHEITRLSQLVLQWIALERQRQPFTAIALEKTFQISLSNLSITLRIDRMDRVQEHLVVIDYKTGVTNISGIAETPLRNTQLPLYSAINSEVAGVYYAQVRRDACRLTGVADSRAHIDGAKLQNNKQPWETQKLIWHTELEKIADAFSQGQADVSPTPGACEYCHLQSFCRISEQSQ